jgi:hypothetical protein
VVRAFLIVIVVVLAAVAGLADSGRGQDTLGAGADSTAADTTAVDTTAADTTVARKLDTVPGFHPQYLSSYRVNRQSHAWGQSFNLNEQVGPMLVGSQTTVTINEDLNRNRNERTGTSTTSAEMDFGHGLWAGVKADLARSSVADVQNTRNQEVSTSGDLTATYSKTLGPLRSDLSGAAGVTRDEVYGSTSLTPYKKPTEGQIDSVRVDSTRAQGTNRHFSGTFTFKPTPKFNSVAVVRTSSSNLKSRAYTFFRGRGQTDTLEVSPADDSSLNAQITSNYRMGRSNLGLDAHSNFTRNHRYVVGAAFTGTETQTRIDRSAALTLTTMLPLHTSSTSRVYANTFSQEFAKQRDPNSQSDQHGASVSLSRTLPLAIEASTNMSADLRKNTFEQPRFTPNDVRTRQFSLSLKKPIGPRLQVTGTTNLSLISYFYHPNAESTQPLQDRDDYRQVLDLSLTYKPGYRFDTSFSMQRTRTRTVNIDASSSGNNTQNERYQILATITYAWSARTSITQRYSISADYTQLDFRPEQNSLTRETKVSTQIKSQVTDRTVVELDHDYRFRDSGSYAGTPRLYGRSSTDAQQDLDLNTQYSIVQGFSVNLKQSMDVRRTKALASGNVSKTLDLELVEGFNLNHAFSGGLSVSANFNRTDDYLQQPLSSSDPTSTKVQKRKFWVIQASLNKGF